MENKKVDRRTVRYQHVRPELLEAATQYVLDHGVSDLSLRPFAQALGVSHATLIHHFATKQALINEVLGRIRLEFEQTLQADELRLPDSGEELLWSTWRRLCRPREQRQFQVLFELAANFGRTDRSSEMEHPLVGDWIEMTIGALARHGYPAARARVAATFLLAQVRGLQLDLLATGEQARVDDAFAMTVRTLVADGLTTRGDCSSGPVGPGTTGEDEQ
ncbi:TetR/AcrR family transcriptional regulator [Nocardia sp. NPDC004860]|uniref:TetR/AcrR family transcriptional regulator n=1 Tax=Nocardia sp. NPDC004860 TaxID=3154557 RepID=UPI0033A885FD